MIDQPHMGIRTRRSPGAEPRHPCMAIITKVEPHGEGIAKDTMTVDVTEIRTRQVHANVLVTSASPRGSENPRIGDVCIVAFDSSRNDSPYVQSYVPGKTIHQETECSSIAGESRKVHESGTYCVNHPDGSMAIKIINSLDIFITDE